MRSLLFIAVFIHSFSVNAQEMIPEGFVMQVLEPTGGKIVRPENWFYTASHRGPSYNWILSKEDASKSGYETGVRIQTLVGVEEGTGKSPKTFVLDFLSQKKKGAQKIHKTCTPSGQDLFTRVCLETEEGDFRILYSLFWGNNIDVVVVSIAGTKTELWEVYANTFERMSTFELIDMKRFEEEDSEPEPSHYRDNAGALHVQ